MTSALISPAELNVVLGQDGLVVLDASYGLPPSGEGIPGAIDFDIDDIADPDAELPHTVPSPEVFAEKVGALGVGNGDAVVIYDRAGIHMAACRVWWMFRLFGHENVRVLDGGLPAWQRAGLPVAEKARPGAAKPFKAAFRPELLKTRAQMVENLDKQGFTVLDARAPGRFDGSQPEARAGIASGHIPQSCNVPYAALLNPETGCVRPRAELQSILGGDRGGGSLACTCGSGVTACVVALGLYEVGITDAAVYDGSWTEWGADPALPKAVGAA